MIKRPGRSGGRYYNIHIAIVELVDQHDEAPRRVLVPARESGNVRDEHRVIEPRKLDVVILTAGSFANILEFEPDHSRARGLSLDVPILHRQRRRAAGAAARECRKALLELRARVRCLRIQIRGRLLQLPQSIVDAAGPAPILKAALDEIATPWNALAAQTSL